ncbi:MAG: LysR family transcriptional regulator [Rhodobacter sp.]|nr:LysR family transcriptional regulator [Rhodobacter sp.]
MLRTLPPLAQLRAFAALAETGAMSAAGSLLNVSHAAISQQVRSLEAHLGTRLVVKDGRSVALTPEGERLGQTLANAFGAIAREIDMLTGADADRPLQLTTTPMFASGWLMPRIADFHARHPDTELMVNPSPGLSDPSPGGFDFAIRYGHGDWPGLEAELLVESDFLIMASRRLIGDRDITDPRDLLEFPWLQELGTNEVDDWLRQHGVTEARVKSLTHLPGNLLLDGLRAGQGIAATSRTFVKDDIARGDLRILFTDANSGTGYFIVTPPGVQRPKARDFIRWLRRQARQGSP